MMGGISAWHSEPPPARPNSALKALVCSLNPPIASIGGFHLEKHHDLAAILSHVESRRVNNDYTILFETKIYQDTRKDIMLQGLRGPLFGSRTPRWLCRRAFP